MAATAAAARKVQDACSEFKLPKASEVRTGMGDASGTMRRSGAACGMCKTDPAAPSGGGGTGGLPTPSLAPSFSRPPLQEELRGMTREQWMQAYGGVLQSEQWFDAKSPGWNYDPKSWW